MSNTIWNERDQRLRDNLGILDQSDGSVPGADRFGRYAVLSHTAGKDHHLTRALNRQLAEKVAAACITDGEWIEGVFDLGELDGDEPEPDTGDLVMSAGERWRVLCGNSGVYDLIEEEDWDVDNENQRPSASSPLHHVRLIERSDDYEEERDPKFYPVADVTLKVTFNK